MAGLAVPVAAVAHDRIEAQARISLGISRREGAIRGCTRIGAEEVYARLDEGHTICTLALAAAG